MKHLGLATRSIGLTLLMALAGFGCATPRSAQPLDLATAESPTGALLNYELAGDTSLVRSGGCQLKLVNVTQNREYFVTLRKEETAVFVSLPPGRYFGNRLNCSLAKMWDLEGLFGTGFTVEPSKISYVGKITFTFAANDLQAYRHAPRAESAAAFAEFLQQQPGRVQELFISGYTGRPIRGVEGPIRVDGGGFNVFAEGTGEAERVLEPLLENLKACSNTAMKQDPLQMGSLRYVARYRNGRFTEMQEKVDENTFSDSFRTCIDNSLRTFKPTVKSDLTVRTTF